MKRKGEEECNGPSWGVNSIGRIGKDKKEI